jgi:hypothetical protein
MTQTIEKNVNHVLRELIKKDRDLQIAIAQEINVAVITVYHWAAYHPERLARNKAALRVANKYIRKLKLSNTEVSI